MYTVASYYAPINDTPHYPTPVLSRGIDRSFPPRIPDIDTVKLQGFGGRSRSMQFKGHPLVWYANVAKTRGSIQLAKMAEEKRVLVKLGDSNWPVSFLSDGENDQDVLKKEVRKVYRN